MKLDFNDLKKSSMKELLSQYPPKSAYLQNENNWTSAFKKANL